MVEFELKLGLFTVFYLICYPTRDATHSSEQTKPEEPLPFLAEISRSGAWRGRSWWVAHNQMVRLKWRHSITIKGNGLSVIIIWKSVSIT